MKFSPHFKQFIRSELPTFGVYLALLILCGCGSEPTVKVGQPSSNSTTTANVSPVRDQSPVSSQELPTPPLFSGRDGLQPPLTLRNSTLEQVSQVKLGYPLWDANEEWGSIRAGRYITIRRSRFRSRQEAIDNVRSSNNPGANMFRLVVRGKWDAAPTVGQRSVTIHEPNVGLDVVMFVFEKQFVFVEFSHPTSQNATSRERALQIAKDLETSIKARRESGEDEPEPVT